MARDFARKFYNSVSWRVVRDYIYYKNSGICEICHGDKGAGEIVHHIIHLTPDNINDPTITLNPDNLMLVCRHCHADIHEGTKSTTKDTFFDSEGNLISMQKIRRERHED